MSIKSVFDDLKTAVKIIQIYKEVKNFMANGNGEKKEGIKSTEFYVMIASILGTISLAIMGQLPADLVAKIVLIGGSIYTICRTIVKLTPSKADDELLEKIVKAFQDSQNK